MAAAAAQSAPLLRSSPSLLAPLSTSDAQLLQARCRGVARLKGSGKKDLQLRRGSPFLSFFFFSCWMVVDCGRRLVFAKVQIELNSRIEEYWWYRVLAVRVALALAVRTAPTSTIRWTCKLKSSWEWLRAWS